MKGKMWILLSLLILTRLCSAADSAGPTADGGAEPAINMLRDTWIERVSKLKGRTIITHRTTILKELLDQQPTNVINAAVGRVCRKEIAQDIGTAARSEESYDAVLLAALVDWAVDKHDRVTLVRLLRHNCPRVVEELMPPEFYLATQWPGSITSLFEAYETAATTSAKKELLACLERAFAAIRKHWPDEAEFIREAKKWYEKNRSELSVNEHYPWLAARSAEPDVVSKDLFVPK